VRRHALAVALVLGVVPAGEVRAEGGGAAPLRLDEVLTSVERSFPLLRAAEMEKEVAAGDLLSAEGGFDLSWKSRGTITPVGYYDSLRVESTIEKPTAIWGASAFAGWKLGTGKFAGYDGSRQTLEYGEVRGGLNVPLWRNGPIDRRRATLTRAELGKEVANLSVAEQKIQFRRAAAHRYWAWVASGRRLDIAQELLDNVANRDDGLAKRVERGDIPPIDRTDNARALNQRRAQLAAARRGLEQATIELGLYLRGDDGNPLRPSPDRLPKEFPQLPGRSPSLRADDLSIAQSRRPEATRLQAQFRQNQVELDFANNQLAPGIDLQVAGSRDFGRSIPGRPDLDKPILEATVLLDIPIQTRAMRGRAQAASAAMSRIERQKQFAKERIEADVRDAQSAILAAWDRIEATRREVQLALELERAERTRLDQGDSNLLIVNIREQQTAEAELREVDALLDYYRATADLDAAKGG
jgi:cobalt-zinc-cadmium efflux system outer membrane protein